MAIPAASATAPSPPVFCAEAVVVLGVKAAPCFREGKHPSLALLCSRDIKVLCKGGEMLFLFCRWWNAVAEASEKCV